MPVLNYFKDAKDTRDYKYDSMKLFGKSRVRKSKKLLATSNVVDYRDHLSPVKDQGNLGSCVGFAVTGLKEFHENVEYLLEMEEGTTYERTEATYDLSEQWTYWNAKKIDPWGPSVEGTSIRYALKVLQKIGCPPEKAWPYVDNAINIGEPESWSHLIARWNTIESYWRLRSVDDMISALQNTGPIVVGVGCYEEIFSPEEDGFVPYPKYPQYCYGGHALLICGFDHIKKRMAFKNSWGTRWGKEGYGWFSYDYMRDFCWDAWAAKDDKVVSAMMKGSVSLI